MQMYLSLLNHINCLMVQQYDLGLTITHIVSLTICKSVLWVFEFPMGKIHSSPGSKRSIIVWLSDSLFLPITAVHRNADDCREYSIHWLAENCENTLSWES